MFRGHRPTPSWPSSRTVGELDGLNSFEAGGVIRVVVDDVIFHFGHVREAQLTVWALMDDLARLHTIIVLDWPTRDQGPSTFVLSLQRESPPS